MRILFVDGGLLRRAWGIVPGIALFAAFAMIEPAPLAAVPQDGPPAQEAAAANQEPAEATPASEETEQAEPQKEKGSKATAGPTGTPAVGHIEEFEKKKTADGEIETRRVRSPNYAGDRRILHETEIRTKKLPDGSTEREFVLRNPDGSGRMMPIEIIREKSRTVGDVKTTDREVLKPDSSGRFQPSRKERVTQTGQEKDRRSVREVRERNLSGDWKVVDREVTTEKSSEAGKTSRAVRQTPNVYGELADFEVREEKSTKDGEKESREVSVRRRDTQDTHNPKFFLVERTRTEQNKTADGKVTRKTVTESDLVSQGASRNVTPGASKVVEERTEEETTGPDGATRRTVTVKERGSVDRELRPAGKVVQETDSKGNVRQIYIPAR